MDTDAEATLKALLAAQPIAALGTLRRGRQGRTEEAEPSVSMVPVAWLPGSAAAVIHVSALSPHTREMLDQPRVSLMLVAHRQPGDNPQALPRVTVQADAAPIAMDTPSYVQARSIYLARFAQAAQTFELGDFSLFALVPRSVRFIAGFGRAYAVGVGDFARIAGTSDP